MIFHLAAQADVRGLGGPARLRRRGQRARHASGCSRAHASGQDAQDRLRRQRRHPLRRADPADLPVAEHHAHRPLSPYGVSKKAAIDYLVAYRELHGMEFTALALANVYGPRQDPHGEAGVVAIFAGVLVGRRPCVIFGDGKQTRDYVYVDDVVDAFARAAQTRWRSRAQHRHRQGDLGDSGCTR